MIRRLLLVLALCSGIPTFSQVKQARDSAKQQLQSLREKEDSTLKAEWERRDSAVRAQTKAARVKADSLASQSKAKYQGKANSYKQKLDNKTDSAARSRYRQTFSNKTDSTARSRYKQQAISLAKQPLDKAKSLPKSQWEKAKSKIPKGKDLFSIGGTVRSESYATTAQNPLVRSEKMYSRLYLSPTITVLGLPFTSNFFFTTEANNTYKNNFFSIRFDVEAMRRKAAEQVQNQVNEARKLDRLRQVDLQKYGMEQQRYEQELDRLKQQRPDLKEMEEAIRKQTEAKVREQLEQEKQELEEKIKNLPEEERKKLEAQYQQKKDSMMAAYKQGAMDSLSALKDGKDTAVMNRYMRLQSKIDQVKAKKKEIEDLRQMDSAGLLKDARNVRDPDQIRKMAQDKLPGKELLQSILSIDRFGIGLVNPQYSEFTLFAASVKGLDIGINKDKYFYDLTLGKTTRQFLGPFSGTKPVYDRYIGVVRLGIGELKGQFIAAEYLYAFDDKITDPQQPMVKNGVLNVSGRINFLHKMSLEANAAQSTYKESFVKLENIVANPAARVLGPEANMAYQGKLTQTVSKNIKLDASIRQTGAGFRTVGNPFLRRNFREAQFNYEQQMLKNRIKLTAFYKEMRDNLSETNIATNRMKGYGLKLSTAFEKYPNLMLSYSPYQQGNNHPDSLYRTNNQFAVTTAMLTYKKQYKTLQWNMILNYTRSAMQISGRGNVAYQLYSAVNTLQIGQRHTFVTTCLANITTPFVDSLNSRSVQVMHNYLATKKLSLGWTGEYTRYLNGALKAGGGLQATANLMRNLSVGLVARYDKIHHLWRLADADVFTGKLVVVWVLR